MDIVFVLVEPARGENIGAAARAIKTMGFKELRLVNPGDMRAAQWVAHHSNDVLEQAVIVDTLDQALADVDLSIACTARHRLQKDRYVDADRCAELVAGKGVFQQPGPASRRLSAQDRRRSIGAKFVKP